jgi:S-adenosyl-L-methionine hydrolase (adenosine-forming)
VANFYFEVFVKRPLITLLTDFGNRDTFVGTMKGVILSICPEAQIVDLTHEVPPQAVVTGAFLLKTAMGYFPKGTVHLAVVDPGVGSRRKAIAIKSQGHYFVGPDNGLFPAALEDWGIEQVVELTDKKYQLPNSSSTFHGRDVFAPVAAHLAKGVPLSKLGKKLTRWVKGEIPKPRKTTKGYLGQVLWVDHFGNLITNLEGKHVFRPFRLKIGRKVLSRIGSHYAEVKKGEAIASIGSSGHLEISVNSGRADLKLGISIGASVDISRD